MKNTTIIVLVFAALSYNLGYWRGKIAGHPKPLIDVIVAAPVVPVPPKTGVTMAKVDERLHELRVQEFRGALFELLAMQYVRAEPVDLKQQAWVARMTAKEVGKTADQYSRVAMIQGAEEFAHAVETARP